MLFQGKNRKAGVNLGPYGACGEIAARHRDPLGILNLLNSHPTVHLFQRGQLHRDRLRPAGPDLGGPLPAGGSQPVAHQEHGQHARLAAGRRQPSLPPAFPQQPLGRKSHHDPGDGVAVSAFFLFFSSRLHRLFLVPLVFNTQVEGFRTVNLSDEVKVSPLSRRVRGPQIRVDIPARVQKGRAPFAAIFLKA